MFYDFLGDLNILFSEMFEIYLNGKCMRLKIYWLIIGRSRIVGQSYFLDDVSFVCDRPFVGFASIVRSVDGGICVDRM